MKRALVIALMLVLAGGALVSAQTFTGSWDVTSTFDIYKLGSVCGYQWWEVYGFTSELVVDYTVGGFVFESKSSFDAQHGFNAQEFSAAGSLGAFSLAAKMEFLPSAVTTKTQQWIWGPAVYKVGCCQTESRDWFIYNNPAGKCYAEPCCEEKVTDTEYKVTVLTGLPGCSLDYWTEITEPAFKDFELTASVSLVGVQLGGLFLMNAWAGTTTVTDVFFWDVCTEEYVDPGEEVLNLYWANVPQSGSLALATDVVQTDTCTVAGSDPIGAGSRLQLAGSVGGMDITSFTYFNMTESDNVADTLTGCPVLGKAGDYAVAAGCGVGFIEEYFMVEGIPFCCNTTLDAALKLVCPEESETLTCVGADTILKAQTYGSTVAVPIYFPSWDQECTFTSAIVGFEYLQLLVKGIQFIPGFFDLTASVKFTTTAKEFSLCGVPSFGLDTCFSMTLLPNWEEDEAHNGIANKFTGIDIKDISLTCEFPGATATFKTVLYDLPTNALKTISSDTMLRFLVPASCDAYCPPIRDADSDKDLTDADDGIYLEYWDTPKYKYYAWESFGIVLAGDACCGGAYEIAIDNYIGKEYEANPEFCGCICIDGDEMYYVEDETTGEKTVWDRDTFYCTWNKEANYTEAGQLSQLFSWMATDVDVSVSLFSNFTLTVSADVSFRGWEIFNLGFGFIW